MNQNTVSLFDDAEIFSVYTRRQAIEDGVLVDLMQSELAPLVREAGFTVPVAVTSAVFHDCIDLTPAAKRMLNDIKGRTWDVLWMLRHAVRRAAADTNVIAFELYCVIKRPRASRVRLKAVIGLGDDGEAVITIMYPHES